MIHFTLEMNKLENAPSYSKNQSKIHFYRISYQEAGVEVVESRKHIHSNLDSNVGYLFSPSRLFLFWLVLCYGESK